MVIDQMNLLHPTFWQPGSNSFHRAINKGICGLSFAGTSVDGEKIQAASKATDVK
jgi:hypothetical protein